MSENFIISLIVTAIGMGLVFAAIILLWLMMSLLMKATEDRKNKSNIAEEKALELKMKAASVAVAVALAQSEEEPHEFPLPPTALVSAWQAVMRSDMLRKRGKTR